MNIYPCTLTTLVVAVSCVSGCHRHAPQDFSGSAGTNQPVLVLQGHARGVNRISFSPDGTYIASAGADGDATVKTWNAKTGKLLRTLQGHDRGVYNVAFGPD